MNLSLLFRLFRKNDKSYWEKVYASHAPENVGWFQERPEISLRLIADTGLGTDAHIIDVGGGASRLAGMLLARGYRNLTVFDISSQALHAANRSLANEAAKITWIEGDITSYVFEQQYEIWHDRAVFHFLTESEDRRNYLRTLNAALAAGGHFIISTFGLEAPSKCSGLPVVRYTPESLGEEIGSGYKLVQTLTENHKTPAKTKQEFIYCHFQRSS